MIHKAKKSMGQNFLKSESALRMMSEAGSVSEDDIVLEIGPGKGALTTKLLERAKKVIAIEKDYELIPILEEKFKDAIKSKKLELLHADILKFDPKTKNIHDGGYKIISNIPYNITGAIIKRFLQEVAQPSTMVLLVQKEVAERIVARENKESILSLSVKAYGTPAYIMKVGKRFFSPIPKVDSAIVAITSISRSNFNHTLTEGHFFTLIKSAFAHKRKVLRKNLEVVASPHVIEKMFFDLKIEPMARSEDVAYALWLAIARFLVKI